MDELNKEQQIGAFKASLIRNYKQIREDRADAVIEMASMIYKRKVEDLSLRLKQLKRDRDNMIDLSPATTQSLSVASDFKATDYVEKDHQLGCDIRNLEIEYELAKKRYKELFGEEV